MESGSGGIELLSLYNDEEDEDEMDEALVPPVAEKQRSASTEVAQPETVTRTMEIDVAGTVEASSTEREKNHQLSSFTSPPPAECLKDTQGRENRYLGYKGVGKIFNIALPSMKGIQNLDVLHHAASYEDDQIQYGFGKDVLDPHGYVKSGHVEAKIE